MNRTRIFVINTVSTGSLQVVTLISGLVIPRIILQAYGSSINGLVTSITQFVTYIALVEAGLGGAAIYALYKPLAENDIYGINKVISTAKKLYNQAGLVFLALLVFSAIAYPTVVSLPGMKKMQVALLVFVLGCKGLFDILIMGKYSVLLTADQKIYVVSLSTIAFLISNILIIVFMCLNGFSVFATYSVSILSLVLKSLILYQYVKKKYKNLNYGAEVDTSIMKQRWDVLYLQVLGAVQRGVPIVVLTIIASMNIVSVYAIYNMTILGLSGVLSIFVNSLFASFGDVIAKKETGTLQQSYSEFEYAYYLLITWAYITAGFLIVPFVKIYTAGITDANYDQPLLGILVVLNSYFYNLKTPQGMLVISAGLYRETRWRTTTQALIAIIGCFVFGKIWGLTGVMIGMIFSNLYRCIDLFFFIPEYVTKLPVLATIKRVIISSCSVSAALYCVVNSNFRNPDNFALWTARAIEISVLAGLLIALINYFSEPVLFKSIIQRFKKSVE